MAASTGTSPEFSAEAPSSSRNSNPALSGPDVLAGGGPRAPGGDRVSPLFFQSGSRPWGSPLTHDSSRARKNSHSPLISSLHGSLSLPSLPQRAALGPDAVDDALAAFTSASAGACYAGSLGDTSVSRGSSPALESSFGSSALPEALASTTAADPRSSQNVPAALGPGGSSNAVLTSPSGFSPTLPVSAASLLNSCLSAADAQKSLSDTSADNPLLGSGPSLPPPMLSILPGMRPTSLVTSPSDTTTTPAANNALDISGTPWPSLPVSCTRQNLLRASPRGASATGSSLLGVNLGAAGPTTLQSSILAEKSRTGELLGVHAQPSGMVGFQQVPSPAQHAGPGHHHARESLPKVVGVRYDKVNKTWRASWYDPQSKRRVERKFSVNKLGFINAYNMATECRKLQEQKLGLRDRSGRKQQQQQAKSPSMTSGSAGVIGSGPTPGCLPAVDLQQQQELLNQASAWAAASHSLLSERLDKDSLQQFLPFDLGHALGHQRASPHAGVVGMAFNSAGDGTALGAFPQAPESLLGHSHEPFSPIGDPCTSVQRQLLALRPPQARGTKTESSIASRCFDAPSSQPQALASNSAPSSSTTPTTGTPSGTANTTSSRFGRHRKRKDPPSEHTPSQLSRQPDAENAHHVQDRSFADGDDCEGVWRHTGVSTDDARISQDGSIYTPSTSSDSQSQSRRNHRVAPTEAVLAHQQEGSDPEGGHLCSREEGGRTTADSGTTASMARDEGDASKQKKKEEMTGDEDTKRRRLTGNADSSQENDCGSSGTIPRTPPSHSGGPVAARGHGEGQDSERLVTANSLRGQTKEVKEEEGCDRGCSASLRGAGGQMQHGPKGSGSAETTAASRRRCNGGESQQLGEASEKAGSRTANAAGDCYQSTTGQAAERPADESERSEQDGESALLHRGNSGDGERTDRGRDTFTTGPQTPVPTEQLPAAESLTPSPRQASEPFLFPCHKRRSILSASSFASSLLIPSNFSLAAFALSAGPESSVSPKALQDHRGAASVLPPLCSSVRTCRNSPDSPLSCAVPVSVSSCPGRSSSCCCGFRPVYQSSGLGVNCCGRRWSRGCCADRCQIIPHHPSSFNCSHHLKDGGRYPGSSCTRARGKGNNTLQASSSRQRKEEGWDSLPPLASSSSSPAFSYSSSCCRNSCGQALQPCGNGTEECKFDGAILPKADADCAHSPSASENNKPTGPILILHLTKELLLLLLQSVQDAVGMLTAEHSSAAQTPRGQDAGGGSNGDEEQVSGGHGRSSAVSGVGTWCESNTKTDERSDEGSATASEKRGGTECGVSSREAMVCVAVLERHKQTVRSASNVDSLSRYTKVFRACIKTKQVPTQLPQATLFQLLRQLLTMSPRQSEEDSGTTACRRAERTEQMRASSVGNPDTGLVERGRLVNTGSRPLCRQTGEPSGPQEEKASTDSETGQSKGGRSSRVTSAGSDEAGVRNDEDSEGGETGQADFSREAPDAKESRSSREHCCSSNAGAQGLHQGGRQNGCRREDVDVKERVEERAYQHMQSEQHSHRHNTRSRSSGYKGQGAGSSSNPRPSAQTGPADLGDDPICLGSLNRSVARGHAGRRGLYKGRQKSAETEHSGNRGSGCADDKCGGPGKEGQAGVRPGEARDSTPGLPGGMQIVSGDTRDRSHRQQGGLLQKESSATSIQVSPPLSPNLSRTESIDKPLVNVEATGEQDALHVEPPAAADEADHGLIAGPSSDYEGADGSAMREGETAMQDSLVQLLL